MSNKIKILILFIVTIILFIFGFNYLKGKNILSKNRYLFAVFNNASELMISNSVFINGINVGTVSSIKPIDNDLKKILVNINLHYLYKIPKNSIAIIKSSPLGSSKLVIELGDSEQFLKVGDTLITQPTPDIIKEFTNAIDPILFGVSKFTNSLDTVLININYILNFKNRKNLEKTILNIERASELLAQTLKNLNNLTSEKGQLSKSFENIHNISQKLDDNKDSIIITLNNLKKITNSVAEANLGKTILQLNSTLENINSLIINAQQGKGTVGQLINNQEFYQRLNNTIYSLNILLDDLKTHPARYVNFSIFGKKHKTQPLPLIKPLADTLKK